MNIVFVSNQPFPFGMAGSKRIRLFAEHLAKNNSVKVIVAGKNNGSNAVKGVFKKVDFSFSKFNRIQTFLSFFRVKNILKQNIKTGEQNIIFLYDGIGLTNFLFAAIGKRMGYKIVTDVVEDYSLHSEDLSFLLSCLYKINTFFEKRISKFADGVVVISNRLQKKILNLNVKKANLCLITISAENCNSDFIKDTSDPSMFTFIYSGSYGNKDGLEFLIQAFKLFSQKKENVQLLLAGKINSKTAALINDQRNIKYVGLIPDDNYYRFLETADVLLMTRIDTGYAHSGFPFKLGEYLATGKPVIATKVSDVEVYLKDKEDILLAEPSNKASLESMFDFAYNNRDTILEIGKRGKAKCEVFFNPLVNGNKLEIFLSEICNAN